MRRRIRRACGVAVVLVLGTVAVTGQSTQPASAPVAGVVIDGKGVTNRHLSLDELRGMPRAEVTVTQKDGARVLYAGVRVADVLAAAGMKYGQNLRGERLADYLVVEGSGAYRVVFALTELDAEFSDRVLLLADTLNGAPLPDNDGPLRLIVSDERKHARWVRGVRRLMIATAGK